MNRLDRNEFRNLNPNSKEYWLWWRNAVEAMIKTYYGKRHIHLHKDDLEDEINDAFLFIMEVVQYKNSHGIAIQDPFALIAVYSKTPLLNTKKQWRQKNEIFSEEVTVKATELQSASDRGSSEESDWWEHPCEDTLSIWGDC